MVYNNSETVEGTAIQYPVTEWQHSMIYNNSESVKETWKHQGIANLESWQQQ
jgi:hypothetical protein